jgi:hypothetical protein
MKRIISLLLVVILVSGCGRLQNGGNAENFDDISGVVKHHTPLSSDPANLPAPTTSPTPAPTAHANPIDELCGSERNTDLYFLHSFILTFVNIWLIYYSSLHYSSAVYGINPSQFITILRIFSDLSFPVHVYLTNPSFLSKSKMSLTALAADTCLSLWWLITKNPSVISCIWYAQFILEVFRVVAYPHIRGMFSLDFHLIKGAILK